MLGNFMKWQYSCNGDQHLERCCMFHRSKNKHFWGQNRKIFRDFIYKFILGVQSYPKYKTVPFFIYTIKSFWNSNVDWHRHDFTRYPLWVAYYGEKQVLLPGNWSGWNMWQYTENGRVPGINGSVDLSRFAAE